MNDLILSVKQAISNKNWFAALFLSLTLPDICGAMEFPNKRNGDRYRHWYNQYLLKKYKNFTGDDCWRLRNACLHEGSDNDTKMTFERVRRGTLSKRQEVV